MEIGQKETMVNRLIETTIVCSCTMCTSKPKFDRKDSE